MLTWSLKSFSSLSLTELYEILKLRSEVFVVEQNCVFQDMDDKDQPAYHLLGWKDQKLIAYSRLLAPGTSYDEMSIGRVVTSPSTRTNGYGKELMEKSISHICELFGHGNIKIGAQLYLLDFYNSFGFKQIDEPYIEDGIPHIHMLLNKNSM